MTACSLTIAKANELMKAGDLKATELVQSCIDRIDAVDEKLNAVVHRNFDSALAKAKEVDAKGDYSNPLAGIPYLIKDNYCEKGVPSRACSNILQTKDYVPPFDCTTSQRLNAAGAISIGRSNTDEFTMGASSETSYFGPSRNPWDTTRVAGGSSGGSAAGVAADECVFALGTDTCGSVRLPAGFCSCVGIHVTYGRTSRYGVMSMASSLDTIDPMTKTVEDNAIVLEAIAGHDPLDGTTKDVPVPAYTKALTGDVKGITVGVPTEYFIDGMSEDCEAAIKTAIDVLKEQGATIKEISLPLTKYAIPCYYVLCPSEVSSNMARYDGIRYGHHEEAGDLVEYYHNVRSEGFGDEVKRRIMIGTYALSAGYYDAYYRKSVKVKTMITQEFEKAFEDVDVIVSPVSPGTAFPVGAHSGDPVAMYLEDIFMAPQVLAGIPAISVPAGFSKEGLPIGLQVMGPQWGEEVMLKAAHAYEQATEWHTMKPEL